MKNLIIIMMAVLGMVSCSKEKRALKEKNIHGTYVCEEVWSEINQDYTRIVGITLQPDGGILYYDTEGSISPESNFTYNEGLNYITFNNTNSNLLDHEVKLEFEEDKLVFKVLNDHDPDHGNYRFVKPIR